MLAARIEGGVLEWLVDIGHVRNFRMIERHDHVGLDHALQHVVGGNDHIVAGVAALELGKEFIVVGEQIHLGLDAGGSGEIRKGGFADIGVPVIEIELLLLLGKREARQQREAGEHGAGALQKGAAAG